MGGGLRRPRDLQAVLVIGQTCDKISDWEYEPTNSKVLIGLWEKLGTLKPCN